LGESKRKEVKELKPAMEKNISLGLDKNPEDNHFPIQVHNRQEGL
jgi:hypothetical protein